MKRIAPLLFAAVAALIVRNAPAHAYDVTWRSNVVYISGSVSNAALAAALRRVEEAAEQKQLPRAVELLASTLDISDTDARQELAQTNRLGCPLAMQLKWLGLHYASAHQLFKMTATLAASYRLYLNECMRHESCVRWPSYMGTLLQLTTYEGRHGNIPAAVALFEQVFAALNTSDPLYRMMLGKFMDFAQRHKDVPLAQVRHYLDLHDAAQAGAHRMLTYHYICLCASRKERVLPLVMTWLQDCSAAKPQEVQCMLDLARVDLSPDRPDELRAYYALLTRVALIQPGNESSVRLIAYLLNEKKKLEAIMPALTQ